ncbi:30S ribosomal protein S2 [Candidatus Haliotispira prima]|uniref:Small ribosomal subunit protein uS2 n=1 Tax=Candidatus Haliotispira prima TaxID=3034016 RepID=A0ABY8MDM6_9SPIO|nr:30S ribosomal protein S2 [Candidatus Haliotispira prima]
MTTVSMKSLLEAGVHFGHQTKRWDPRMKKYIFTQRNGIHIVDLQKTVLCLKDAYMAAKDIVINKKSILFVGTKKQAQEVIKAEAERCGMHYINHRWLGGMLTNFSTIKRSLYHLKKMEKMEIDGSFESMTKKEVSLVQKEKDRLEKTLGGIKEMKDLPGAIFVVDTRKEHIAIAEANRLNIPVIAILDTNCNPEGVQYPIPGNDDAIRAIQLFTQTISSAVLDAENEIGLGVIESMHEEETNFMTPADELANYQARQVDEEQEVYDSQSKEGE